MTSTDEDVIYSLEPESAVVRPPDPIANLHAPIEATASVPEPKCPNCGYIVIGVTSGVCPECGKRVNWRLVVEAPELHRLTRLAWFDFGVFWLGVALNVFAVGRLYWLLGSAPWLFFLFLTPYLMTAGIWLAYRAINGDELRWALLWTGSIASAMAIGQWVFL